ncbi:hypothetical protein [Metamycoplasma alkalescens]|uniref:hypothetical protein n=1 Tax=Metamycoplasma alkalescens TaxID=45363 RepID=UPI003CFC358F
MTFHFGEIIFNNISLKNEFDFVIKKIANNLLNTSKRENYFKNKEFEDFIKDVLIDVKKEFSNLLTKSINHIKSNKELFEKTIKTITTQIKTVYQINLDKKINSIEYFIFNLFDSLEFNANKKDNLGYELIDIFIKSLILKTNKNKKITRNFFEVLALNNQVEYNEKNQVFFKLINYLPNKNNLDKSKYLEGMKYLGTSLIKIDEFFNPTEINDLITNQTSLFNFFKNLSNYQKISKNTDETKKHFQDFISLIIDESLNNNFIKQLIDKFGSYLIINPMLSYLKNNHLEKEILDLNPNFENIEDLVKDWYKGLYQLIASKEIINKLKTFIHNLIFDENKHKKEGLEKFIISILENKDENGLLDLIKEITNQITTNKYGTSFLVDILIKSLNKKFKINLDENIKKELLENINQIIRNLPNSDFLKTWIKNLIEIIKTINVENKEQSKISKIQKIFNWLFSNSSQKIITEEIIKNFFALLEIDDKKNDQSQSQKINFSLKLFKIILEKIENVNDESVKNEIKKLFNSFLTNSIVKKMIQNQTNRLEKTILKENAEAEEFAKETINKINKIIFDQEINNEVINSVVTGILNIKKEKIGDINNWSQLFKKIIDKKQLNLKSFINKTINKLNSDQEYINKLFSFLLTTINKKYDFEATGDETKNIANFLAKLTLNLKKENEIAGIVEEFASVLINDLFNNKNANQQIEKEFFKTLKKIEYKSIFTKNFFEKITKAFFDKNVNKEEFTNQLLAIYNYLSRNLPKIKQFKQTYSSKILLANSNNNNNNNYSKDNEEILVNFLNSFNNLFIGEKNTAKEVFIEITHKIIQNQIKQAITSSDPRLKNILLTLIKNTHFKKLVDSVINEFLNQKNQIHSNSKDIISNIVEKISTKLKSEFKNIIKGFSNDQNLIKVVVNNLIDFLNLKDTNSNDKELLEKVIKESINYLIDTDYFETKIVKRTTEHFSLFSKQFNISNPFQWIIEFAKKIKSGFSFKDLGILSELVGKDKPINGNILVRLINLIFEKSNLEKSSLYDALRNINMDDDRSKRTNMQTLNDQISIGSIFSSNKNSNQLDDPNNISPEIDLLKLLDNIFKILHLEYEKNPKTKESNFYVKSQTDEWKAIYRLKVAFDFFIFEMFGRETLTKDRDNWSKINLYSGTRAILWELQEGENISWIPGINNKFSGMQTYFKDPEERRQFTNYLIKDNVIWPFRKTEYFDEDTYGPESITYIIVTSGYNKEEKNNQPTEFKYKIDLNNNKKITKKEYILLTLKEGGYAKFMKLNNHTSKSEWSGLNKVEFNNIQPNK